MNRLIFKNINDENIIKMIEKDLDVMMYNEEKAQTEDRGIGKTSDKCVARLSTVVLIGKIYLHLVSKNACRFGKEERIYS